MNEPVILTVEDVGVWALHRFQNTDKRIRALTLSIIFLSGAVFLAGRRISRLEADILAMKQPVEEKAASE